MRVPDSWLGEFLNHKLTTREIDDLLSDAGVTVAGVEAIGVLSPRVVAARVEADGTGSGHVCVALPTRELADLPAGDLAVPAPGSMTAVALPGAALFAAQPRHGMIRVAAGGGPGQAVGRVCTTAELGLDHQARIPVLPAEAVPGVPVASLFPHARGERVLTLRIPAALVHCRSLSGLAEEINSRLDRSVPRPGTSRTAAVGRADRSMDVRVTVPGMVACAILLPAPAANAGPVIDWRRPALAGLRADTELTRALLIAAFEYGACLSAHLMPGDGPVTVNVGPDDHGTRHGDFGLHVTPSPLERPGEGQPRLLVLATDAADLAGGPARCQQAAERVVRLLSPGDPAAVVLTATAFGPETARRRITVDLTEIAAGTGLVVGAARCSDLLGSVGARSEMTRDGLLEVAVPPGRPDLDSGDALLAELIRLLGFAALPATVPEDTVFPRPDRRYRALSAARQVLASHHFHEMITPFVCVAAESADGDAPGTPWSTHVVSLAEPAGAEARWLRRSLVPGLVRAALGQVPPGVPFRLYEMGTVVRADAAGSAERWFLAVLRSTPAVPPDPWPPAWEEEYWEVLDAASAVVRNLDVGELGVHPLDDPRFHSGTGARLTVSGRPVGHLGALRPDALAPVKTGRHRLVAAELDLEYLFNLSCRPRVLTTPPRFPVTRDISLVLRDDVPAQKVLDAINGAGPPLRDAKLAAVYRDPREADAPRVLTIRLTLGSPWRTLSKQEAASAVEQATLAARTAGALPRWTPGSSGSEP